MEITSYTLSENNTCVKIHYKSQGSFEEQSCIGIVCRGCPDYFVTGRGAVISLRDKKHPIFLKQTLTPSGYYHVSLVAEMEDGTKIYREVSVHTLVAESWISYSSTVNPDGTIMQSSPEVNHKDGNKRNNCYENLEWCDRSYNIKHMWKLKKLRKEANNTK